MLSMEVLKRKQKSLDGILEILCVLYGNFFDTLARKEVFIQITGIELFSLWFCHHRWAEDIKIAEQDLKI